MVLVPVLFAVSVFLQAREDPHVSAASMGESPAISQKYIEGYAAMCVLSEYPLFGVGIGNYQARIGEFYQGMPKDNTLLLGTRIGFGVILASIGLLGLTAFCYWLVRLMLEARGLKTHARVLPGFFVVVFVWAFFTPVFVGQVMMPIVFAHGWIMGSGGE
jgi:O-antigen ligase